MILMGWNMSVMIDDVSKKRITVVACPKVEIGVAAAQKFCVYQQLLAGNFKIKARLHFITDMYIASWNILVN